MPLRKSRSRKKITKKSRSKSARRKPRRNSRSKRRVLRRSKSRRKPLRRSKSRRKPLRRSKSRRKPLRRSKSRRKPLRRSKSRRKSLKRSKSRRKQLKYAARGVAKRAKMIINPQILGSSTVRDDLEKAKSIYIELMQLMQDTMGSEEFCKQKNIYRSPPMIQQLANKELFIKKILEKYTKMNESGKMIADLVKLKIDYPNIELVNQKLKYDLEKNHLMYVKFDEELRRAEPSHVYTLNILKNLLEHGREVTPFLAKKYGWKETNYHLGLPELAMVINSRGYFYLMVDLDPKLDPMIDLKIAKQNWKEWGEITGVMGDYRLNLKQGIYPSWYETRDFDPKSQIGLPIVHYYGVRKQNKSLNGTDYSGRGGCYVVGNGYPFRGAGFDAEFAVGMFGQAQDSHDLCMVFALMFYKQGGWDQPVFVRCEPSMLDRCAERYYLECNKRALKWLEHFTKPKEYGGDGYGFEWTFSGLKKDLSPRTIKWLEKSGLPKKGVVGKWVYKEYVIFLYEIVFTLNYSGNEDLRKNWIDINGDVEYNYRELTGQESTWV